MQRRAQNLRGFSIVEIVLGMTIMSILTAVTVNSFSDANQRSREQIARTQAKEISNAIQRWQLDNRRPYPFRSVAPLVPKYLRNLNTDPWSQIFHVNTAQRIVYSYGANGRDEEGGGDDVSFFYDSSGDVAPAPPENLVARLDNNDIKLNWNAPARNVDGSPLAFDVGDLSYYNVQIRSSRETQTKTWVEVLAHDSGQVTQESILAQNTILSLYPATPAIPDPLKESYYFTVKAIDQAGNISASSNQAGLFITTQVSPEIIVFEPSSKTPAVSSAFYITVEVVDADANLTDVRIVGLDGGTHPFGVTSPFRFSTTFVPTPAQVASGSFPTLTLEAEDASGNTTDRTIGPINFINRAPVITALTPGIVLLTATGIAADTRTLQFTMEAIDRENNLSLLRTFKRQTSPITAQDPPWEPNLTPPGPAMVRTTQVVVDVQNPAEFEFVVEAVDAKGLVSQERIARIRVTEDTTPPDALAASLNPSNSVLSTAPPRLIWYVTDPDRIEILTEAFEIESPPITYDICIATEPFSSFTAGQEPSNASNKFTEDATGSCWVQVTDSSNLLRTVLDNSTPIANPPGPIPFKGSASFVETEDYYVYMRARNSSGLINFDYVEPLHELHENVQNPFRLDATPPEFLAGYPTIFGNPDTFGDTWISGNFSAEWKVSDYILNNALNGIGSGANLYSIRIRRTTDVAGTDVPIPPDPFLDWTEISSLQVSDYTVPVTSAQDNGIKIHLDVKARDAAGNWSDVETATAFIDITPPNVVSAPQIVNQSDSVIAVLDTFAMRWNGVFLDAESGVASYEWGIATSLPVPINGVPDVIGWLPVVNSFVTSASISQNNLLVQGDTVFGAVRARNFAGSVSPIAYTSGALVNVNLFTDYTVAPATGLSPLSVEFTAEVSGGTPPYDYRFQFDGTELRQFEKNSEPASIFQTDYLYDPSTDTGLPQPEILTRLTVTDSEGRQSTKDATIDIRTDVLLAVGIYEQPVVAVYSMTGAGVVNLLYTARTDNVLSTGHVGALAVHPLGEFMMTSYGNATGSDLQRTFSLLDVDPGSGIPLYTNQVGFGSVTGSPTHFDALFKANSSQGVFLAGFDDVDHGDFCPGPPLDTLGFTGFLRSRLIQRNGFPKTSPETKVDFACDATSPIADVLVRGVAIDPGLPTQGVMVVEDAGSYYMKLVTSLGAANNLSEIHQSAVTLQTTTLPGPIDADRGNLSEFGSRTLGSKRGFYLVSRHRTGNPALYKVGVSGGGLARQAEIQGVNKPAGDASLLAGVMDIAEDGGFYVVGLADPGGANWKVAIGKESSTQLQTRLNGPSGNLRALELDPGGTLMAAITDTSVLLYEVDRNASPVTFTPVAGSINLAADLNTVFGTSGSYTPSSAAFFRRPKRGLPELQRVFSSDDALLDTTSKALDGKRDGGSPVFPETGKQFILQGYNLDVLSRPGTVITMGLSTPVARSLAAGTLPPAYGSQVLNARPLAGDGFHFALLESNSAADETAMGMTSGAGGYTLTLSISTPTGSGPPSVMTTTFIYRKL